MISSLSLLISNLGNRPSDVDKSCQNKPFIGFTMPESGIPEGSRKSFCWKVPLIIGVPTALTPYPFPSLFFLLTSFLECSLHDPHTINATDPGEFFTCATRLEGTCKFSYRLQYCFQLKNFTVPRVACKGKADPCKFLTVEKFVKGRSVNSSSDLSFDDSNSWCISAKNTPINQHISLRKYYLRKKDVNPLHLIFSCDNAVNERTERASLNRREHVIGLFTV